MTDFGEVTGWPLVSSSETVTCEVFTPSAETVDSSRRMIAAFREAEASGHGAVDFEGQHIDYAHVKTAEGVIELAAAIGL